MAVQHRTRRIIDRHREMKSEKEMYYYLYQLMGEYIMTRKQHFNTEGTPGEIQNENIFDDTAINANHLMASSLIGALWPNGPKSFQIGMPFGMEEDIGEETEEIKQYYQFVTRQMADYMDNPKSGFITALEEYMLDQGAFGISGISAEDGDDFEVPVVYRAVDAKNVCIGEGANGFVNTVYIERRYTLRQLVEEYGFENISAARQKAYLDGDCKTKVKVLQAIEPRMERDPYGFGVKNMPIASIHLDIETEKILRESGYVELPVAVTRFWKAMGETYGRSPGMNALPSILEANALGEAFILATEKTLDPALLVLDDGSMGNGKIDTSPGAINVVSVSGRISSSSKPIEPLFLVGDLQWTAERRKELVEIIRNHFFIDRLLDLNNETQMTLGEANIRNRLRGQTLNTVFARQMSELFTPILDRTFMLLFRKGLLGVIPGSQQEQALVAKGVIPRYIPDAVIQRITSGQNVYKINYISPATRIMQAEELEGIEYTTKYATEVAQVKPDAVDNLNTDWLIRRIQELTGAPREAVVSLEAVRKIRDVRAQQEQAAAQQEAARQGSETARNMGQAVSSVANSGGQGAA